MFGAPAVEHFHRNATPPSPEDWPLEYEVTRFQDLTHQEQIALLAEDPHTPWARTTRKRQTPEEKAAMIASAANWLRLGQRVRITGASPSIDGSNERRVGRVGVVWRTCRPPFDDHVHVNLDLVGQERSEKIVFVELRDVEPIDETGRSSASWRARSGRQRGPDFFDPLFSPTAGPARRAAFAGHPV